MPRSAPSAAALAVVDDLHARGVELSARQIESLQARGVLPKGTQVHDGGGGSRIALPDDFLARAEAAGRLPVRRRSAANVAAVLYIAGHPVTEADALAVADRARELLDEMIDGLADEQSLRTWLRGSRSPAVRRTRRVARSRLATNADFHDERRPDVDEVDAQLAFELSSIGRLLSGDKDADVDETLVEDTMLDRAVAAVVHRVLGKLGAMLIAVGDAPELVTADTLASTQWVWTKGGRKRTIERGASLDTDTLVCAMATVVGIANTEGKL